MCVYAMTRGMACTYTDSRGPTMKRKRGPRHYHVLGANLTKNGELASGQTGRIPQGEGAGNTQGNKRTSRADANIRTRTREALQ